MLRARPLAPLAAGFCAGIALALLPGAWGWLAAFGALAAVCIIRWRHPALLALLGLGLGALRQHAAEATRTFSAHVEPLEGVVQGPPRIYRSLADPRGDLEEDGSFVVDGVQVRYFRPHRDFVRRVAPETILVSAPEGYSSAKVLDELPFPPRTTGREGAIEIPLK